jgi:hypothetical protein
MRTIIGRTAIFGAAICGLTSGCSNPGQSQIANDETATQAGRTSKLAPSDACSVLHQADAEEALGHKAEKLAADGGTANLDICQFGFQGERLMDSGHVSLIMHANSLEAMQQGVAAEKAPMEKVQGIGDGAIYTPGFGLYVGKGGRTAIYMLGVGGITPAETKDRTIALAKATIGRI